MMGFSKSEYSISQLIEKVESALVQGKIERPLRLIHDFVERIITEPLCAARVFASRDLDNLCQRVGQYCFRKNHSTISSLQQTRRKRELIVYLVSRLQNSGGHLRLIIDLIRCQPGKDHLILATGIAGRTDEAYIERSFAHQDNFRFVAAPQGNMEDRLIWLQKELMRCDADHVYLFNHHQDSVVVAAFVPELGLKGSFCHHGDHHLCLGVHLEHATHIDFHPMGYHYCHNQLGILNHYLPLTFEDKGGSPIETGFSAGGTLISATVARANKVEIPYYVSYLDLIPKILKLTGGYHIHIGKLTPWGLYRMRAGMRRHGVPNNRLIYIEWAASVWEVLQKYKVDVYLASFPYGAGLTLIEVMGAGVPVIMHQHMFSRVLAGLELAYPGAYCWTEPQKLLSYLSTLSPEQLRQQSKMARTQYETFHQPAILKKYLDNPALFNLQIPPLVNRFQPRYDEWAAWAEAQMTISHIAYRLAYRIWRKFRNQFRL